MTLIDNTIHSVLSYNDNKATVIISLKIMHEVFTISSIRFRPIIYKIMHEMITILNIRHMKESGA